MIPRGEVGLIFAGIGAKLMLDGSPVIDTGTYSAVVIMVIITTLVTPPALVMSMNKWDAKKQIEKDKAEAAKA
jgi:Kef-type K+ transport system membrane component KefB